MAQTLSDEACRAYMLSGVDSLKDGKWKKRDLSRSGDARTLLDINGVQGLLAFTSVSVPCDTQDHVHLPTVPSNPWLFSSLHQVLSPPAF